MKRGSKTRRGGLWLAVLLGTSALCGPVLAQTAGLTPEDVSALRAELATLKAEAAERSRRIDQLERKLDAAVGPAPTAVAAAPPPSPSVRAGAAASDAAALETAEGRAPPPAGQTLTPEAIQAPTESPYEAAEATNGAEPPRWPEYKAGKGFLLVQDPEEGELGMGMFSYVRYLNQNGLSAAYRDSFGRVKPIDRRQDFQMAKVSMNFKGWLFDPKFRYYYFIWTANPNMGEGAQVVVGGYFQYAFNDAFTVTAGVLPLPTTRSTNYTFPNWLRNDNRVMADEFFRGSYTTGIDAQGEILPGLRYRVAAANNLAQLGISAAELDNTLNTFSGALWWMPTTGEFGPSNGFGDFEEHEKLATLFGVHYTQSSEDAQGQPSVNDFENSQIRLSDGTLVFSDNAFNTGASVARAKYHMAAANAAMKYRGWYLEGEYYWRWINDFEVINGTIPVDDLYDHGFTFRGSAMVRPKVLQAYLTYSQIWGEFGDPNEWALGVNWYPFDRKEIRLNAQALRLDRSPVGGNTLTAQVGGTGWVFNTDLIVNF